MALRGGRTGRERGRAGGAWVSLVTAACLYAGGCSSPGSVGGPQVGDAGGGDPPGAGADVLPADPTDGSGPADGEANGPPSWSAVPTLYGVPGTTFSVALAPYVVDAELDPLQFSVASGALPAGLTLDLWSGVVQGTPNVEGSTSVTIGVSDALHPVVTTEVTFVVDGTSPSTPLDLQASAVTARSVTLSWSAASDSGAGVSGYRIYRDGVRIDFIVGLSYAVTDLQPSTTYRFTVQAFDMAGNRSSTSAPLDVTTLAEPGGAGGFGPPSPAPFTACDFFVAPGGDDDATGTSLATAWRTIGQANQTIQPGQAVCLRAGAYDETIRPAVSGLAGQRIIYAAYNGEPAVVRGSGATVVSLAGRHYVTLYGLQFDGDKAETGDTVVMADHTTGSELRYCRVVNPAPVVGYSANPGGVLAEASPSILLEGNLISGWFSALNLSRSPRAVVRGNVIVNSIRNAITIAEGDGSLLGQLIEGNILGGSITSDGVQTDDYGPDAATAINVRGLVIRGNLFYFNAENAIDLKSGGDVVIEGNLIAGGTGDNDGHGLRAEDQWWLSRGQAAVMHGSGRNGGRVIVRRNIFYDNTSGVSQVEDDWHVFNNTFVNNNRDFGGSNSTWIGEQPTFVGLVSGTASDFFNNIVSEQNHGVVWHWQSSAAALWDYNLYHASTGAPVFIVRPSGVDKGWSLQLFLAFEAFRANLGANISGADAHSLVADPMFAAAPARPVYGFTQPDPDVPVFAPVTDFATARTDFPYDFRLQASSPAVDAGRHLTYAVNSAVAGQTLVVESADYFFDGYGAMEGDTVLIGGAAPVLVTAVDYAARTLTLASPRTWTSGDPVDLPFSGDRPDLGACERTSAMTLCALP